MQLILASASPRRLALLHGIGLNPLVFPALGEEQLHPDLGAPDLTCALAVAKAREVQSRLSERSTVKVSDAVIVAADTVVVCDEQILGKPKDPDDARSMLHMLSGRSHDVITGVCILYKTHLHAFYRRTAVHFRKLREEELEEYIRSGESADKAGAYGIQGRAGAFVSSIEGDYFNVVGLPLCSLVDALYEMGLPLNKFY